MWTMERRAALMVLRRCGGTDEIKEEEEPSSALQQANNDAASSVVGGTSIDSTLTPRGGAAGDMSVSRLASEGSIASGPLGNLSPYEPYPPLPPTTTTTSRQQQHTCGGSQPLAPPRKARCHQPSRRRRAPAPAAPVAAAAAPAPTPSPAKPPLSKVELLVGIDELETSIEEIEARIEEAENKRPPSKGGVGGGLANAARSPAAPGSGKEDQGINKHPTSSELIELIYALNGQRAETARNSILTKSGLDDDAQKECYSANAAKELRFIPRISTRRSSWAHYCGR